MTAIGLVLGGGGLTGFAYLTTTLSIVQQITGWDPRNADVIVGTSAGANLGGLLRGGVEVGDSLDEIMGVPTSPRSMQRLRQLSGRENVTRTPRLMPTSLPTTVKELARGPFMRPGRLVTGLLPTGRIRTDVLGDRMIELHDHDWPDEELYITAVRLEDSERVVFGLDRTDVDLGTAVEASSAIPGFFRPVRYDGFRYVDGGMHSPINADLLTDHELDLIVVIAPMSTDSYSSGWMTANGALRMYWRKQVNDEVDALREAGHKVLLIEPSTDETRAMGPTLMDPTRIVNVVMQTSSAARAAFAEDQLGPPLDILRAAANTAKPAS